MSRRRPPLIVRVVQEIVGTSKEKYWVSSCLKQMTQKQELQMKVRKMEMDGM